VRLVETIARVFAQVPADLTGVDGPAARRLLAAAEALRTADRTTSGASAPGD
jgi:hypothetical protein